MNVCAHYEVRGGRIYFCQRDNEHEGEHELAVKQKLGHPIPNVEHLYNPFPVMPPRDEIEKLRIAFDEDLKRQQEIDERLDMGVDRHEQDLEERRVAAIEYARQFNEGLMTPNEAAAVLGVPQVLPQAVDSHRPDLQLHSGDEAKPLEQNPLGTDIGPTPPKVVCGGSIEFEDKLYYCDLKPNHSGWHQSNTLKNGERVRRARSSKTIRGEIMEDAKSEPAVDYPAFHDAVFAEREKQIDKGYTLAHDKKHGIRHLLNRAYRYAANHEDVKAGAMIEAALDLTLYQNIFEENEGGKIKPMRPAGVYRSEAMHHAVALAASLSAPTPEEVLEFAKSFESFLSGVDTEPSSPVVQESRESIMRRLEKYIKISDDLGGQIEKLAAFIIENVPGEPSHNGGAVDTAIRLLSTSQEAHDQGPEIEALNTTILSYQSRNTFLEKRNKDLEASNRLLETSVQNHQEKNEVLQQEIQKLRKGLSTARPIPDNPQA